MEGKIYKLKYALGMFPGEWKKEDFSLPATEEELKTIVEQGWGGTDMMMLVSIIDTGGRSYRVVGKDGRTGGDLDIIEQFKVWMMMADAMASSMELDEERRAFAQQVFENYIKAFMPEIWELRQKNLAKRPTS